MKNFLYKRFISKRDSGNLYNTDPETKKTILQSPARSTTMKFTTQKTIENIKRVTHTESHQNNTTRIHVNKNKQDA